MIVEEIWPGLSAKAGEKNFKVNLHRLRKAKDPRLIQSLEYGTGGNGRR